MARMHQIFSSFCDKVKAGTLLYIASKMRCAYLVLIRKQYPQNLCASYLGIFVHLWRGGRRSRCKGRQCMWPCNSLSSRQCMWPWNSLCSRQCLWRCNSLCNVDPFRNARQAAYDEYAANQEKRQDGPNRNARAADGGIRIRGIA